MVSFIERFLFGRIFYQRLHCTLIFAYIRLYAVFTIIGWNSFANIIYIDQPGGTGFSYVDKPSDYVTTETQLAIDLWNMMLAFYEKYPKYSKLDLYIFGESYGKCVYCIAGC